MCAQVFFSCRGKDDSGELCFFTAVCHHPESEPMSDQTVGMIRYVGAHDSYFSKGVQYVYCMDVPRCAVHITAVATCVFSSRCVSTWILGVNPTMTGNTLPLLKTLRHEDHSPSWISHLACVHTYRLHTPVWPSVPTVTWCCPTICHNSLIISGAVTTCGRLETSHFR